MKILHITNAFTPEPFEVPEKIGGAEVYASRLAKAQAEKGNKVIIITQSLYKGVRSLFPEKKIKGNIIIYSFYPLNVFSIYQTHKKTFLLKALWRLIDLINPLPALLVLWIVKQEKPDIIHNHILHGFSPYFMLRFLAVFYRQKPLVQTLHSYGYICPRCNLLKPDGKICLQPRLICRFFIFLSRFITKKTISLLISPSQFTMELYKNYGFFKNAKKIVIPNIIEKSIEILPQKDSRFFNILFAGRLVKEKGVEILIKAFKMLKGENLQLLINGDGYLKPQLEILAQNDSRIRFIGKRPWEDLKNLYSISHITVVPSIYYEIFGNVVIESMSFGTPVIASRIGGLAELIEEGKNGFLFEPGDYLQLKKILETIINNPELLKKMSEFAFNFARKFNLEAHLTNIERAYEDAKKHLTRN